MVFCVVMDKSNDKCIFFTGSRPEANINEVNINCVIISVDRVLRNYEIERNFKKDCAVWINLKTTS